MLSVEYAVTMVLCQRGQCERFENTGWCPFDHPFDDPNAIKATEEERQWFQAARDGDREWLSVRLVPETRC